MRLKARFSINTRPATQSWQKYIKNWNLFKSKTGCLKNTLTSSNALRPPTSSHGVELHDVIQNKMNSFCNCMFG